MFIYFQLVPGTFKSHVQSNNRSFLRIKIFVDLNNQAASLRCPARLTRLMHFLRWARARYCCVIPSTNPRPRIPNTVKFASAPSGASTAEPSSLRCGSCNLLKPCAAADLIGWCAFQMKPRSVGWVEEGLDVLETNSQRSCKLRISRSPETHTCPSCL